MTETLIQTKMLDQSSATSDQVLTWNGTEWAPADATGGGKLLQAQTLSIDLGSPSTSSSTFAAITSLTLDITPLSTTSTLILNCSVCAFTTGAGNAEFRYTVDGADVSVGANHVRIAAPNTTVLSAFSFNETYDNTTLSTKTIDVEWRVNTATTLGLTGSTSTCLTILEVED